MMLAMAMWPLVSIEVSTRALAQKRGDAQDGSGFDFFAGLRNR